MDGNGSKRFEDYTPNPDLLSLLPDEAGNTINGLGEADVRNPSPVMWHDPEIIPHGPVQKWFAQQGNSHKHIGKFGGAGATGAHQLGDVSSERPDWTPEQWTAEVKAAALASGADLVGITRVNPDWVFEGFEVKYDWMVVLVVAMDYDNLSQAPSVTSQNEVKKQYDRGTRTAYNLAGWVNQNGWDASPHGGPLAGPILMIPAAIEAGLGELGKHGSMINRQFGSSFRLANVLTNIPLVADQPDTFGADDFCTSCQLCTATCPVDAISPEKQLVRGEEKWYVDFDKCILFFAEHNGCAMCLPVCPWSRPGVAPSLAEKMSRRRG